MLEAALKHQKTLVESELRDKRFMGMAPTYSDCEFVLSILPFLKIFYDATICISSLSYMTSSAYIF